MIERYLDYLSAIRRYSPRTIEIYRGVLEDFASFSLSDLSGSKASARQNFASLIPPTAAQRVPPVYEATGGHGFRGQHSVTSLSRCGCGNILFRDGLLCGIGNCLRRP